MDDVSIHLTLSFCFLFFVHFNLFFCMDEFMEIILKNFCIDLDNSTLFMKVTCWPLCQWSLVGCAWIFDLRMGFVLENENARGTSTDRKSVV